MAAIIFTKVDNNMSNNAWLHSWLTSDLGFTMIKSV